MAAGLPASALDREFDLGLVTLRRTLEHIVWNVEAWTAELRGEALPARVVPDTPEGMVRRLETAYARFEAVAREARSSGGWDRVWDVVPEGGDDGPGGARTVGGTVAHVLTHSMHHRCQVLYMLRRLGVEGVPEGDALSSEATLGGSPGGVDSGDGQA